jgi:hypothetical protein
VVVLTPVAALVVMAGAPWVVKLVGVPK